jgi:UDP-N-acetylglucosamine diphosphorylase / glucose-1-phosphate thymidylyltransferase / UDP-N-acetylgalactosamine diphosphorylase / glucosamine-1-phosphate N-acetyltransferase / galactosamine-1-phosphate N-acetyltransferase
MKIKDYCVDVKLPILSDRPWESLENIEESIKLLIRDLDDDYVIEGNIAIHKTAIIEESAMIKSPVIIGAGCFIGSHSLLRGGVILGDETKIGPSCEVKHSIIGRRTAFAHFNFVGDSIIGSDVNLEAGAVIANHYNERVDKKIFIFVNGVKTDTGITKFGALIGDNTKIGANAVTSPGTILAKNSIVRRRELVEQV